MSRACTLLLTVSYRQHLDSKLSAHTTNSRTAFRCLPGQDLQSNKSHHAANMSCHAANSGQRNIFLHAVSAHVIDSPSHSPGTEHAVEHHVMQLSISHAVNSGRREVSNPSCSLHQFSVETNYQLSPKRPWLPRIPQ